MSIYYILSLLSDSNLGECACSIFSSKRQISLIFSLLVLLLELLIGVDSCGATKPVITPCSGDAH